LTLAILITAGGSHIAHAGDFEQRVAAVGETVDRADDMFRGAMKGHFSSLDQIKAVRAQLILAKSLYKDAGTDAEAGRTNEAAAKLDAAEYLAGRVYDAAEH
jgi:hypothetical protein